ncbi:hypothetical protein [Spongiactinospora sp. TRM90649]|uniref:hypothetical protein n=1 Tax=Spongiactinospora sp. TRM90649 TaxID=3031114 RepID=UPI0023F70E33|nr:hypothetical protein [Spongiactinospora sp. TRM90649]MDF5758766.1 hypothetical protein [Spongiactinospora sp. TRM90649]
MNPGERIATVLIATDVLEDRIASAGPDGIWPKGERPAGPEWSKGRGCRKAYDRKAKAQAKKDKR